MALGRAWAAPAPRREAAEIAADAAFWGLAPPAEPEASPAIEVWEGYRPALEAFLAISGQWRTASAGLGGLVWIGLDYTAARAGLEMAGIALSPETWAQVQSIEAGAREALNRRDR